MIPVSVYIITRNEAHNLPRLLAQLAGFSEIILVDSGSDDATLQIAAGYSNVKTFHRDWTGFSDQKAYALSLCQEEWVLNIDADEELTEEYIAVLKQVVRENNCDALQSKRVLLQWGRKPHNFVSDDVLIRLFRKSAGRYCHARVHERITVTGKTRVTNARLLHHENLTFTQRMAKSNMYSELKARDKFEKGDTVSAFVLIMIFPWTFIQHYLGKGHFMDGSNGLLSCMNSAYYNFMKYAKLREMHRGHRHLESGTTIIQAKPALPDGLNTGS